MEVDQPVELLLGGLLDQCVVAVTGVIHQVIKRFALPVLAQCLQKLPGEWHETSDFSGVELQGERLAPQGIDLCDDSLSLFTTALISNNNVTAVPGDA